MHVNAKTLMSNHRTWPLISITALFFSRVSFFFFSPWHSAHKPLRYPSACSAGKSHGAVLPLETCARLEICRPWVRLPFQFKFTIFFFSTRRLHYHSYSCIGHFSCISCLRRKPDFQATERTCAFLLKHRPWEYVHTLLRKVKHRKYV